MCTYLLTISSPDVSYLLRVTGMLQLSSSVFAAKVGSCNRFGNCWQPDKTTAVIVGAIIAVGVVLLVLLIVGAVPLVVCLMRRQKRIKREIIGKVELYSYEIMFACLYLSLSTFAGSMYPGCIT